MKKYKADRALMRVELFFQVNPLFAQDKTQPQVNGIDQPPVWQMMSLEGT